MSSTLQNLAHKHTSAEVTTRYHNNQDQPPLYSAEEPVPKQTEVPPTWYNESVARFYFETLDHHGEQFHWPGYGREIVQEHALIQYVIGKPIKSLRVRHLLKYFREHLIQRPYRVSMAFEGRSLRGGDSLLKILQTMSKTNYVSITLYQTFWESFLSSLCICA